MNSNPYAVSQVAESAAVAGQKFLNRCLVTVGLTAAIGGFVGTLVGWGLGKFMPDYYRQVFGAGANLNFDPISVGIGQGLTQGIAGGAFIGLVLSAMYYHFTKRLTDELLERIAKQIDPRESNVQDVSK